MRAEREAARQQANLVEQARLILSKDKVPRLSDLSMWPAISGRKTVRARQRGGGGDGGMRACDARGPWPAE